MEHRLLDLSESCETFNHLTEIDPIVTPITVEWQKEKCALLGISFQQTNDQHPSLAGQLLHKYEPWICKDTAKTANVSSDVCQN